LLKSQQNRILARDRAVFGRSFLRSRCRGERADKRRPLRD
jgi:hypothetical protein